MSPFKVIYGIDPSSPLDLVLRVMDEKLSMDDSKRMEEIQKLHEQVTAKIKKSN